MTRVRSALEIRLADPRTDFWGRGLCEHGWILTRVPSVCRALAVLGQVRPALIVIQADAVAADRCGVEQLLRCPLRAGLPVALESGGGGADLAGVDLALPPALGVADLLGELGELTAWAESAPDLVGSRPRCWVPRAVAQRSP